MRIGYILLSFPPLSETFIRREILELCHAGHHVFVYANYRDRDPLVPKPSESNLIIKNLPFLNVNSLLERTIREDGIEHLHSSLTIPTHHTVHHAAQSLQIPFTLTAYSGHDIFCEKDSNLFQNISKNPFCEAIIVEDPFMQEWLVNRLGADLQKTVIIPNSFDMDLYRLRSPRHHSPQLVILTIARFVEKKGLIHLIRAFNQFCTRYDNVELRLIGDGPEGPHLRREAGQNENIKFLGFTTESQTQKAYADADIFCLPCIQTATGDADGVPTTILEAMAFELPVISTNLLSTPYYVRDQKEGLLTSPGDEEALCKALEKLCGDKNLRRKLGRAGRARTLELCDIKKNIKKLETIMLNSRWRRWSEKLDSLQLRRKNYTIEIKNKYSNDRKRSIEYFKPQGRLLDIGCGNGDLRFHLSSEVTYFGCDPLIISKTERSFPFSVAFGEELPFASKQFESVVLYCVLINVFDIDRVLYEALRVLKPAGLLYIRACVNDQNPIHLNHFTFDNLKERVSNVFKIIDTINDGQKVILMKAKKLEDRILASPQKYPLASVAITTFNREKYIRQCIDSVLQQSYDNVEIIVVNDGSTDGTNQILEEYGEKIHCLSNIHNRGIAYSKNKALLSTSREAKYVTILDSDDYFHPHFVESCVIFLEKNPGTGLVYTNDIIIDEVGREIRKRESVNPWNIDQWLRTCNLRGDTWLARRNLVMKTKLHDEVLTHDLDYDLFYQLLEITEFSHLPEFMVYYRCHNEQSARHQKDLAKCHAANLIKYGYSQEYAYHRARYNPEWIPAIEEGIALGKKLQKLRQSEASNMAFK